MCAADIAHLKISNFLYAYSLYCLCENAAAKKAKVSKMSLISAASSKQCRRTSKQSRCAQKPVFHAGVKPVAPTTKSK